MLTLDRLTFRLGERLLFDEASAQLPTGARVGFVGRNGTGKTTLFRILSREIALESGEFSLPVRARMGRVEQEAPGGPTKLVDFVLAADVERTALLDEAETAEDPTRIADIHARLIDIEAHSAPARAARILQGLGFDEAAQNRPLSEFSGGWRMRVALAAILFLEPDLLLLDEPTNYLDLEGALWLVDHLKTYPASVIVISHDRDLLDDVCDHILHLDRGKLTLWRGDYSSFERQRAQAQTLAAKAAKKQDERRKHLQNFVDRFRAKATKARQAQSRLKMLEKMQAIDVVVDSDVTPIVFPSPEKKLSPPIVTMNRAVAGYDSRIILRNLNVSISEDDRIGLLGQNGEGKSTLAKLIAGRLAPLAGEVLRAPKLDVGFFAQHQVDELDENDTPFRALSRLMSGAPEARIRARAAQCGFSGPKADTPVANLSGGEKARLLLGLCSYQGPNLLILDEPTNHLDIDSRAALIDAINDYSGAVILVSHDRYLLEATTDRLWLVGGGGVQNFEGDLDDYAKLILSRAKNSRTKEEGVKPNKNNKSDKNDKRESEAPENKILRAQKRDQDARAKKRVKEAEEKIERLTQLLARVDGVLANPEIFVKDPKKAGDLARQREDLAKALAGAEENWLEASAALGRADSSDANL